MAIRERAADRGARLGRQLRQRLGEELRQGRVLVGLSQTALGRPLGWSRTKVSRIERGLTAPVAIDDLARALAVVGLELSARVYPTGSPLRDKGHLNLLGKLRSMLAASLSWATEVPFPKQGDLRTWDALIRAGSRRVGVDAGTRATDWQALERRTNQKARDGGVDVVILVLADTRSNRAFVRDHAAAIAISFPVDGAAALAALRAGEAPSGNALALV